jgi:hypothetical protein
MTLRQHLLLAAASLSLVACGDAPIEEGEDGSTGSAAKPVLPQGLVGSWVEGGPGVTVEYDPATGAYGAPSGSQLVYIFRADGSYTQQRRRYTSTAGCTLSTSSTIHGTARYEGESLVTTPVSGMSSYQDACNPAKSTDESLPSSALAAENYAVAVQRTALRLTRRDGTATDLRRFNPAAGGDGNVVATP